VWLLHIYRIYEKKWKKNSLPIQEAIVLSLILVLRGGECPMTTGKEGKKKGGKGGGCGGGGYLAK